MVDKVHYDLCENSEWSWKCAANLGGVCLYFTCTIHTTWWDVTTLNNFFLSTVYCVYLAVQWNLVNTVTEWAQKKWPYWRGFFFLHENVWRFLPGDQKKWPYQRGDCKAGFHCIFHVGDVSATEFGVKNKPSEIAKIFWMTKKDKMRNPEILFQSLAY